MCVCVRVRVCWAPHLNDAFRLTFRGSHLARVSEPGRAHVRGDRKSVAPIEPGRAHARGRPRIRRPDRPGAIPALPGRVETAT